MLNLGFKAPCNFFFFLHSSLADQKKEEGNQHYLAKNYREALQRYNEAISKFGHFEQNLPGKLSQLTKLFGFDIENGL